MIKKLCTVIIETRKVAHICVQRTTQMMADHMYIDTQANGKNDYTISLIGTNNTVFGYGLPAAQIINNK